MRFGLIQVLDAAGFFVSMKNRYLLSHGGRDQFGNPGDPRPQYEQTPEARAHDELMRKQHREQNKRFLRRHRGWWLNKFAYAKTKKAMWEIAFPHKQSSYSTFCKECKEYASTDHYLCFLLLSNKNLFLSQNGFSREEIEDELSHFKNFGRYHVTFGTGKRMFGSI